MRWYYLWRLRMANRRLRAALDALPDKWNEHLLDHDDEIIEWALAHAEVNRWLGKLG